MVAHTQSIQILDPCPEESPEVRGTSTALAGIAGKVMTPPQSGGLDGCEQPQGLPGLLFERWLRIRRLHPRPQSQAAPDCGCNGESALLRTPPLIPHTPWPRRLLH